MVTQGVVVDREDVVLVVDDDEMICVLLTDILSRHNISVVSAYNGVDALSKLEEQDVDLVLTDVNMPEMTGIVLLEEIKKINSELPVIVMTGYGTEEIAVQALKNGAFNFCRKPFNVSEIAQVIKKGLEIKKMYDKQKKALPFMKVNLRFDIPSDVSYIKSIIYHIYQIAKQLGFPEKEFTMRVKLALDEALCNAIRHGNKEEFDKKVAINVRVSPKKLEVNISDEGAGFDVSSLPDPKDSENLNKVGGRGVLLMGYYMDEIRYNNKGNEVSLVKYAGQEKEPVGVS